MQPTNKEISEAFSNGNFKFTYDHLADDILWNIVGDKILKDKATVVEFCNKTAAYFAEVTTRFTMHNTIVDNNFVAINGTAHFINKENKSTYVSSCDLYRSR